FVDNEGSTVASIDAEAVHALGVAFNAPPGVVNCRTVRVVAPAWRAVNQDSGSSCQGTSAPEGWLEDTDARLGRLMEHTGWTPTHFPLRGSPLIDAYGPLPAEIGGTSLGCSASTSIDQRGAAQPTDPALDTRDEARPSERLARVWEERLGVDLRAPCDIGAVTASYPVQDWVGLPVSHLAKSAAWWVSSSERAVRPGEEGVRLLEVDDPETGDTPMDWDGAGGVLRQELARLLYVFTGRPEVDHEHDFTDTPEWMDDLLDWLDAPYGAAGRAIMAGRDDTTFDPDGFASRHQAAVVLWRLAGQPGPRGDAPELVEETPRWARDAVAWATADPPGPATALLPARTGFGQPTFSGGAAINRSELAAAVYALARSCEAWNPVGPGGAGVEYPIDGAFFAEPCR
ncbi:MAG: choice-of-anchor Q domain-containing protein, partial [Actinomycetota bacterium]